MFDWAFPYVGESLPLHSEVSFASTPYKHKRCSEYWYLMLKATLREGDGKYESQRCPGTGVPESRSKGKVSWTQLRFKEAAENLTKAERLLKELLQCGRIIKDEWIEIQAQITLSFAQWVSGLGLSAYAGAGGSLPEASVFKREAFLRDAVSWFLRLWQSFMLTGHISMCHLTIRL